MHLSSEKLGQSVDDCDALLKKHEAFERLITTQEDKVRLSWLLVTIPKSL